jgi:hypothetical protein
MTNVVVFNNSNIKGLAGKTATKAQGLEWNRQCLPEDLAVDRQPPVSSVAARDALSARWA